MAQKHADADRLAELGARQDELVRELVKVALALGPAPAPASAGGGDHGAGGGSGDSGGGGVPAPADGAAQQLAAELGAGRLVPHWSPEEDLQALLLEIRPGEIKVRRGGRAQRCRPGAALRAWACPDSGFAGPRVRSLACALRLRRRQSTCRRRSAPRRRRARRPPTRRAAQPRPMRRATARFRP